MRPLKAVVLSTNKKTGIRVRLESGPIIILPYNNNINIGETILIKYNFIKKEIVGIINSYSEISTPAPTKIEKGGEDNDPENPETFELLAY